MEDRRLLPKIEPAKPALGLLAWIAGYKFAKALLALSAALVVLHLLHRNVAATVLRWAEFFGVDQQGRLASRIVEHLSRLNPNRLHFFIGVSLLYMTLYIVEGIGLLAEKRWAEWLVVVQSGLLLPWEIYELFRRTDLIRLTVLTLNLVVIGYLLWRIRRENQLHSVAGEARGILPGGQAQVQSRV